MEEKRIATIEGAEIMYDDWGNLSLRFLLAFEEDEDNPSSFSVLWWSLENSTGRRWTHQLLDAFKVKRIRDLNEKKVRACINERTVKDLFYLNEDKSIIY